MADCRPNKRWKLGTWESWKWDDRTLMLTSTSKWWFMVSLVGNVQKALLTWDHDIFHPVLVVILLLVSGLLIPSSLVLVAKEKKWLDDGTRDLAVLMAIQNFSNQRHFVQRRGQVSNQLLGEQRREDMGGRNLFWLIRLEIIRPIELAWSDIEMSQLFGVFCRFLTGFFPNCLAQMAKPEWLCLGGRSESGCLWWTYRWTIRWSHKRT